MTYKTSGAPQRQTLERRELELTFFACLAILVLAAGLAVLMYPAVFSERRGFGTPQVAFVGFCALSGLLLVYITERQMTIHRLRREIELDRRRSADALARASSDLLASMPDLDTFNDRFAMEFRRAAVAKLNLSVLVIALQPTSASVHFDGGVSAIADAVRTVSQQLREQDSIYNLAAGYVGIVLPGVDDAGAQGVAKRLGNALSHATGGKNPLSFRLESISYPQHAATAHDMELAILTWLPADAPKNIMLSKQLVG